jgi:hypothetical protein
VGRLEACSAATTDPLILPNDFEKKEGPGMGGFGSGRHPRSAGATCDDYHSVDLAWLNHEKLLTPGRSSTIRWSRAGRPTGSIGIVAHQRGIGITYRTRPWGGEWQEVDELIPFAVTATNFAGRRKWFKCLSCGRACRVLYGRSRFRCRLCHHLKYGSQSEPRYQRAIGRAQKIRMRLGGSASLNELFPPKPKGMHWKTYHRLMALDTKLQNQWALGMRGWLDRFERR